MNPVDLIRQLVTIKVEDFAHRDQLLKDIDEVETIVMGRSRIRDAMREARNAYDVAMTKYERELAALKSQCRHLLTRSEYGPDGSGTVCDVCGKELG